MPKTLATCPATGLRYRVRVESDWTAVPESTLSFEISINNPNCSGEALRCQIVWAATHFHKFVFSIADTLNEYNYRTVGHPERGVLDAQVATDVSTAEGAAWVDAHAAIIASLLPANSYSLVRWLDWRNHPDFDHHVAELQALYVADAALRNGIQADVIAYARRRKPSGRFSSDQIAMLSLHTLEELAVYRIQCEEGPTVILYPGSRPETYRFLNDYGDLPPALASLHYRYIEIR